MINAPRNWKLEQLEENLDDIGFVDVNFGWIKTRGTLHDQRLRYGSVINICPKVRGGQITAESVKDLRVVKDLANNKVMPTSPHISEIPDLLPEKLISNRSSVKDKHHIQKNQLTGTPETISDISADTANEEEFFGQAEELPENVVDAILEYIEKNLNILPAVFAKYKEQLRELIYVLLKSGKYTERTASMNTKESEAEVKDLLSTSLEHLHGNSPRFHHSQKVASIVLFFTRLLRQGTSWVNEFRKILNDSTDDSTSNEDIDRCLEQWINAIDDIVINQIQRNGFSNEYPLSIREASIAGGTRSVMKFFCYIVATNPSLDPKTFFECNNTITKYLDEWKAFLATSYSRRSKFHEAEKNFSAGLSESSRDCYDDEADRLQLLTAVKMFTTTVIGVNESSENKAFLKTASSKSQVGKMVKLYENKRASIGRTVYAITELDIDSLLNMNPPQSAFELQHKNPFHTLQTHHDTQHSLKFACRTCHQLISNAMKYQCIERQHNIVLAASLSLHYKKTGNDKISDILSIELSAPSIILPIQLPETPPQPTKEYDFFNELNLIPSNVFAWSVVDIEKFIKYLSNESIADKFKAEEIDGRSFMLMSETDFSELKLPLGPKLKILNAWKYLKSFAH
uniref:SAM domain-containing protein n=1 Tax=Panagrolaimus superbus TaxID=310955 RepID=A0A914YP91_9BILA